MSSIQQIDDGVFLVPGLFSPAECGELIERAEKLGFESAGVRTSQGIQMRTEIRNNDRLELMDLALAETMWQRIKDLVPKLDGMEPCGVDANLRFYRYVPGQQFKSHIDGAAIDPDGNRSLLSYLVYLNDSDGGQTRFRELRLIDGVQKMVEFDVSPTRGTALLFRHTRKHAGMPVHSGVKYVLRSDVFYRQVNGVV